MNEKSGTDTTAVNFKKRFPTSKVFVDWLLANPHKGNTLSFEERMQQLANLKKKAKSKD